MTRKAGRPVGTGKWRKYRSITKPITMTDLERAELFIEQAKDKYHLITCDYVVGIGAIYVFEHRHLDE